MKFVTVIVYLDTNIFLFLLFILDLIFLFFFFFILAMKRYVIVVT